MERKQKEEEEEEEQLKTSSIRVVDVTLEFIASLYAYF